LRESLKVKTAFGKTFTFCCKYYTHQVELLSTFCCHRRLNKSASVNIRS